MEALTYEQAHEIWTKIATIQSRNVKAGMLPSFARVKAVEEVAATLARDPQEMYSECAQHFAKQQQAVKRANNPTAPSMWEDAPAPVSNGKKWEEVDPINDILEGMRAAMRNLQRGHMIRFPDGNLTDDQVARIRNYAHTTARTLKIGITWKHQDDILTVTRIDKPASNVSEI